MTRILLSTLLTLLLSWPVQAQGIVDGWQGARWGTSQQNALAIWRARGWRYKYTLDDGFIVMTGKYAGYNASLFVESGALTTVFIAIDSQNGRTSAQIWADLHTVIERKYGTIAGLHWRRADVDDDWQEVDSDSDDMDTMSKAFYNAHTDLSAQWTQGPVDLQLFTGKLDNGNRCVFVKYLHTQGAQRKHLQREKARTEAV